MNTQNGVMIPANMLDTMVKYINVSSLTAKKACDQVALHEQQQKQAADLRPGLLKHLVDNGIVAPQHEKGAEAMLGQHSTTMTLLKAAADKIIELKAQLTKQATDEPGSADADSPSGVAPDGTYNSLTSPLVGMKTAHLKESDKALLRGAQ